MHIMLRIIELLHLFLLQKLEQHIQNELSPLIAGDGLRKDDEGASDGRWG